MEEGEEEKESSSSGRDEPSVGARLPREDDSDASSSKRSRSGSDRPLADAGALSTPRDGDDDDSIPPAAVTSRTNLVRDTWMPSPSEIRSGYGSTSPLRPYALYSCTAIIDDDVTKELDFDPATDQMTRSHDPQLCRRKGCLNVQPIEILPALATVLCALSQPGPRPSLSLSGSRQYAFGSQRKLPPRARKMSAPLSSGIGSSDQTAIPDGPDIGGGGDHDGSHTSPGVDASGETRPPIPADTSQDSPPPNDALGDDGSSVVGQESASSPVSPQPVVSRIGVLDVEAVVRHVRAGVLPSHDRSSPGCRTLRPRGSPFLRPAVWGGSFIVGIPAHAMAYRNGAYVREGYAGVEALMLFDGLSEPDVQDL
ncbi:hypothetical protein PF004_g11984 [Phytophthora fragariae]|uniref:Uncharacterized protein n=1 Tax=Phytophthora fragariae TaxID=53985 RepID=A0A6G0NWF9_9STRA|nr:hypothetical protein PF004_g11984 [Phytophthora fragariae]